MYNIGKHVTQRRDDTSAVATDWELLIIGDSTNMGNNHVGVREGLVSKTEQN